MISLLPVVLFMCCFLAAIRHPFPSSPFHLHLSFLRLPPLSSTISPLPLFILPLSSFFHFLLHIFIFSFLPFFFLPPRFPFFSSFLLGFPSFSFHRSLLPFFPSFITFSFPPVRYIVSPPFFSVLLPPCSPISLVSLSPLLLSSFSFLSSLILSFPLIEHYSLLRIFLVIISFVVFSLFSPSVMLVRESEPAYDSSVF